MNILIIIPAYNEFENIINLINDINKIKNFNINLLVVDDSTDFKIYELIKENQYKNVEYINRGSKLGRGSAVRFGFEYAIKKNFDCIFEMDADYSHNPNEIIHLIKQMVNNKYDMVIASRYLKDTGYLGKNEHRERAANILKELERVLLVSKNDYIYKNRLSILDICIFPLVRQFRIADKDWFDSETRFNSTSHWLHNIIEQDYFKKIMVKYAEWVKEKKIQYFSYQDTNRIIY